MEQEQKGEGGEGGGEGDPHWRDAADPAGVGGGAREEESHEGEGVLPYWARGKRSHVWVEPREREKMGMGG